MNDLPLLWTFYQVAKAGGVSAGAKRLFVTQSAASQALKKLPKIRAVLDYFRQDFS